MDIHASFGDVSSPWVTQTIQSKKISNDQELIQSDPISCPQNQTMEITKYINWRQFTKGTRGKQNEQLFPKQAAIQLPKIYKIYH